MNPLSEKYGRSTCYKCGFPDINTRLESVTTLQRRAEDNFNLYSRDFLMAYPPTERTPVPGSQGVNVSLNSMSARIVKINNEAFAASEAAAGVIRAATEMWDLYRASYPNDPAAAEALNE
ncbi:hypothetical protein QAD02_017138 [Eretmocerus hayati]|uniref:Uncharacterized protein n=1 Tax=Eretmocerus hayati TaxID=131215 RepID=A0ACC2PD11_9HYME|nr:hypothetical protein QAD02_017138 [Eretmocerus hayati]